MSEWSWRRLPPPKTAGEVLPSLQALMGRLNSVLRSTFFEMEREARPSSVDLAWDPANILAGASTTLDVALPGVRLGNVVLAGFSQLLPNGLILSGRVVADSSVRVTLKNESAVAHDAAAGILSIRVWE